MRKTQYKLVKINLSLITANNYDVNLSYEDEVKNDLIIAQDDSLLLDQIRRIRGYDARRVSELILVEAKRNPQKEDELRRLLEGGFNYNGVHYVRFGKSASQGKAGITVFVDDRIYDELFAVTQLDIPIDECVISKYEAQRCLVFSTCTLLDGELPNIVIVDEFTKVIPDQHIKYIVEKEKEFIDKDTGEVKKYKSREVADGPHDIKLSPFDGCGCHNHELSVRASEALGLEYNAIGLQIRLPFFKGYSVEFPFREYYKSIGIDTITDVFGHEHNVDVIDCIWNTSMFKGYKMFKNKFGADGWLAYLNVLSKYDFKLGISKYSHHIDHLNLKTRMNFQYLQCLNIWNDNYRDNYLNHNLSEYDILDPANDGSIVKLARYSTDLFEKIIKGDKFYTYKFMGVDTADGEYTAHSKYLEAALINDTMLKDVAVRQFIYRKLKKYIAQLKVGKIYADGFYHTVVGDMIGYLQYAAGIEPVGCLNSGEFFCDTIPKGDILSFRSPLVCPSEVNAVKIVGNDVTQKWFSHFKNQDVVMINMYDLSMPQQGGMDADGDVVFLCHDPLLVDKRIDKTMIIDVDDKVAAQSKAYTPENIVEYELNSRDNRIGEITNVCTSILNKYTTKEETKKKYDDYVSLLRILQGKEIDFLKTGVRWHMNKQLRTHIKCLPYFLLYNYPKKLKAYEKIKKYNQTHDDKLPLNAYHSPSPLNELCDYIDRWEKKKILWDRTYYDTRCITLDNNLDLSDKEILKRVRRILNDFGRDLKKLAEIQHSKNNDDGLNLEPLIELYSQKLSELNLDKTLLDNYVIKVSYSSAAINKTLAWSICGDTLLDNLRKNSPPQRQCYITETSYPSDDVHEYLGKYYILADVTTSCDEQICPESEL